MTQNEMGVGKWIFPNTGADRYVHGNAILYGISLLETLPVLPDVHFKSSGQTDICANK
jgi:hypothetical protein